MEPDPRAPKLFTSAYNHGDVRLQLTLAGWEHYTKLKRVQNESRTTFMAMKFGDAELNDAVARCFRPAVQRAGFDLRVLTDHQEAGLINDQIRAALRKHTFAFVIGCAALVSGALPACAAGLDWKVLSYQSVKEPEVCFYGSANVFRANGRVNVWTKCLAKEDLDKAVKADSTGSLSDIAAEKIAHAYVPPIAKLNALQGEQIVDAVMNEELANNGNIRPLVTALREIDCAKRRAQELSVITPVDGQVRSSDTPQDWHPVPSTGELASLSKLLCPQPAPVRHYRRSTSPGKVVGKFNGRRR
jgi:hypothetical protein